MIMRFSSWAVYPELVSRSNHFVVSMFTRARGTRPPVRKAIKKRREQKLAPFLLVGYCELFIRQKNFGRSHKFYSLNFGGQANALESSALPAAAFKGEQILVVEMGGNLVEITLERNRRPKTQEISFRAGFFRHFAQFRLRVIHAEKSTSDVPGIRSIYAPDIDVVLLRVFDRGIHVRTDRSKIPAKVIDTRRNQQDRASLTFSRQSFNQVLQFQIRTGKGAKSTIRNAQRFGCERVVRGEILTHDGRTVTPIKHADIRGRRLSHHEGPQVVPLVGDILVQRIIN